MLLLMMMTTMTTTTTTTMSALDSTVSTPHHGTDPHVAVENANDVSEWKARLRYNWARIAKVRALPVGEYLAWIDMEIEQEAEGGEEYESAAAKRVKAVQDVLEAAAGDYAKSVEIWRRWLQWAQQHHMDALTSGDADALEQLRKLFER